MANRIVAGLIAGAAGTLALNVVGYADMALRGRPASRLPARMAARLADEVGLPLDFDADDDDEIATDERLANRHEAIGALLGYTNGLGIGAAYGVLRLVLPRPPSWLAAIALGSAAMAASDVPATRMGLTDPAEWGAEGWLADIAPHLAYGFVTAAAFELIRR